MLVPILWLRWGQSSTYTLSENNVKLHGCAFNTMMMVSWNCPPDVPFLMHGTLCLQIASFWPCRSHLRTCTTSIWTLPCRLRSSICIQSHKLVVWVICTLFCFVYKSKMRTITASDFCLETHPFATLPLFSIQTFLFFFLPSTALYINWLNWF